MKVNDSVFVAGGETTIGRAIVRALERSGQSEILAPSRAELPLTDALAVDAFVATTQPRIVVVAAGRSGGIGLNRRLPAQLMLDNLLVATSVLEAAARHGVEKLLYLASSCCYPKACSQPMRPELIGSGPLEQTSEAYATAKIAGLRLCQALRAERSKQFVTGIPADVFGPDSSFDPEDSHVIPALIARFHAAKMAEHSEVVLWGSGMPRREFLFADDLGEACITAIQRYNDDLPINLGGGEELAIREVAVKVAEVVGYNGKLVFDTNRPDGMPRKLLDSSVILGLGWRRATPFSTALEATYCAFLNMQQRQAG